jgi:acid phosphatase family membrane protein YuiD
LKKLTSEQRAWAMLKYGGSVELPEKRKLLSDKTQQVLAGVLIGVLLTLMTIICLSF